MKSDIAKWLLIRIDERKSPLTSKPPVVQKIFASPVACLVLTIGGQLYLTLFQRQNKNHCNTDCL